MNMIGSTYAAGGIGALIAIVIVVGLYMLPTIIGWQRKVVNVGSVFAVNLLLGWTLIGWAVALAMALRTNPPHAYGQYWQPQPQPTQAPPPPGWYTDATDPALQRWWDGTKWTDATRPTQ